MAFATIATRLPKEDEEGLEALMERERIDRSAAARKAIELGLAEWKKDDAIRQLRDGGVTLGKAAELAGLTVWEMLELVRERRVDYIRITREDMDRETALLSGE